jgi:hypothetical protein
MRRSCFKNLFQDRVDVSQATGSLRVRVFAKTVPRFDPGLDEFGNGCLAGPLQLLPNIVPKEIKTVTDRHRIFLLLDGNPFTQLILREEGIAHFGIVNDGTFGRQTESVREGLIEQRLESSL